MNLSYQDLSHTNFGLSGQADFDYFIFCGKRCKKRKEERQKARMEKKQLKNDRRRAETEQLRAETKIMQQTVAPEAPPEPKAIVKPARTTPISVQPSPITVSNTPKTVAANSTAPITLMSNLPQKAQLGTTPMLLIGLAVIGGIVVLVSQKK